MNLNEEERQQLAAALADFTRSLALRPNHPFTLYNLACLYSLRGDFAHALTTLSAAIESDPENGELDQSDPDFDRMRADPAFRTLVGFPLLPPAPNPWPPAPTPAPV